MPRLTEVFQVNQKQAIPDATATVMCTACLLPQNLGQAKVDNPGGDFTTYRCPKDDQPLLFVGGPGEQVGPPSDYPSGMTGGTMLLPYFFFPMGRMTVLATDGVT